MAPSDGVVSEGPSEERLLLEVCRVRCKGLEEVLGSTTTRAKAPDGTSQELAYEFV